MNVERVRFYGDLLEDALRREARIRRDAYGRGTLEDVEEYEEKVTGHD